MANVSEHEIARCTEEAASWIAEADAFVIGSGAGMGVDSGLGTFRGSKAGVWKGLEEVGLDYEQICKAIWFETDPRLAWGFWNFCHNSYQATSPHEGYTLVSSWTNTAAYGGFCFTSNIDSHWAISGFDEDRIVEVHGAVKWLQCCEPCCPDVWQAPRDSGLKEDLVSHRAMGVLPTCPNCGKVARPAVLMFGKDVAFSEARLEVQTAKYEAWLQSLSAKPGAAEVRLVCIEIGCGLTVPTVREELERLMMQFPGARLIRVNPEDPGITQALSKRSTSLPLGAHAAICSLTEKTKKLQMAVFFILGKDHAQGIEVRAPMNASLLHILQFAKRCLSVNADAAAALDQVCSAEVYSCRQLQMTEVKISLSDCVPDELLGEDAIEGIQVGVLRLASTSLPEFSELAETSIARQYLKWSHTVLTQINVGFSSSSFRSEVQSMDRLIITKAVLKLHDQVLKQHGISASDSFILHLRLNIASMMDAEILQKMKLSYELSHMHEAKVLQQKVAKSEKENDASEQSAVTSEVKSLHSKDVQATQKSVVDKALPGDRPSIQRKLSGEELASLASRLRQLQDRKQETWDGIILDLLLSFLDELVEGFSAKSLQQTLSQINAQQKLGAIKRSAAYKARLELFMPVQFKVLPRYGFEGSLQGVSEMMSLMPRSGEIALESDKGRIVAERGVEVERLAGSSRAG